MRVNVMTLSPRRVIAMERKEWLLYVFWTYLYVFRKHHRALHDRGQGWLLAPDGYTPNIYVRTYLSTEPCQYIAVCAGLLRYQEV